MARLNPVLQGQSPVLCQLCEIDPKIQWKCEECNLLLCKKCKDTIHSKVKTAEEHRIINIKEVGTQSVQNTPQSVKQVSKGTSSDQDTVRSVNRDPVSLDIHNIQEYPIEFCARYIQASLNDSLWIGSVDLKTSTWNSYKSAGNLMKVQLERDNLKIISSFNVKFYDIAITQYDTLILTDYTPKLKQIVYNSNKVTESNYCVKPFDAESVHVTRDNKVVVGACSPWGAAVYVMDMNGVHQNIYRHDKYNQRLFTRPCKLTSTSIGTLCVIDLLSLEPSKGRIVMLQQGACISVYIGHPRINTEKKLFTPVGVVSTSNDNIIITDAFNCALHIINNRGDFLEYYDTRQFGVQFPYSLAFSTTEQLSLLYIGCPLGDENGKLYRLTLSGC